MQFVVGKVFTTSNEIFTACGSKPLSLYQIMYWPRYIAKKIELLFFFDPRLNIIA